jgi:hypothetical protein
VVIGFSPVPGGRLLLVPVEASICALGAAVVAPGIGAGWLGPAT